MVLDAAKGIEEQTRKLFEVCRLRDVPIITFVNKLDRESRDPFDLLDEIEQSLALDVTPASWPIGMGRDFLDNYDLFADALLLFERGVHDRVVEPVRCSGLDDPKLSQLLPKPHSPNRARRRKPSPIMCGEPPASTFRLLCPMMPGGSNDAGQTRIPALGGVVFRPVEDASDSVQHYGGPEGLVQEGGVALASFGDHVLPERTYHDDWDALVNRLRRHCAQHFSATEYRHHEVQQDHVGLFR